MLQIQAFSAFLLAVGIIATAVFVVACFIKASRDQADASNRNWSAAVDALQSHNDALKEVIEDMSRVQSGKERELSEIKAVVARLEESERSWTRRNTYLYELVQTYRAKLKELGFATPDVNGDR